MNLQKTGTTLLVAGPVSAPCEYGGSLVALGALTGNGQWLISGVPFNHLPMAQVLMIETRTPWPLQLGSLTLKHNGNEYWEWASTLIRHSVWWLS